MEESKELEVASITTQALAAYAPIRQEIHLLVDSVKDLDLPDPSDKKQAALVIEKRKELKKTRCAIDNIRMELKRPVLELGKEIDEVAKDLKSLMGEEESRLSLLENDHKQFQREEKERKEREHQEMVDHRCTTMQHLGVNMPPSVLGAMDEKTWSLALEAATEEHDKKLAERKAAEAKREARLAAAEANIKAAEEKEEWATKQMIDARVTIAQRMGLALSPEDAASLSKDEWKLYQESAEAKIKAAKRQEIAKDQEVAEAIAGGPVKVSDVVLPSHQGCTWLVSFLDRGLDTASAKGWEWERQRLYHLQASVIEEFDEVW